jgi:hypothetical protein
LQKIERNFLSSSNLYYSTFGGFLMRTAFMWAVSVCSVLIYSAALAGPVAQVVGLKGEAVVIFGGKTTSLAMGNSINEGSEVRTANPGRVKLRFLDGSVVVVSDASTLKIEKFQPEGKGSSRNGSFVLDIGLISQKVSPSKDGSWEVRTPSAVTAVRGTEYIIEVKPNLATEVTVQGGSVQVKATNGLRNIPPAVILDEQNYETTCNTIRGCKASKVSKDERLRELNDRLSGV